MRVMPQPCRSARIAADHRIEVLVSHFDMFPKRRVELHAARKIPEQANHCIGAEHLDDATYRVRAVRIRKAGLRRVETRKAPVQLLQRWAYADHGEDAIRLLHTSWFQRCPQSFAPPDGNRR